MAVNQILDSLQFDSLEWPYDPVTTGLSGSDPRLFDGLNMYVTPSGTIARRPEITPLSGVAGTPLTGMRVERMWYCPAMSASTTDYIIFSVKSLATNLYSLYVMAPIVGSVTALGAVRSSNSSTRPHEAVYARGKLFIKSFPAIATGETLGTVLFDNTVAPAVLRPWGALGPTSPTALQNAAQTYSTAAITAAGLTLTVASQTGFPVAPFDIHVGYEIMTVTAVAGAGPYNLTVTRGVNGTLAVAHNSGSRVLYRAWTASAHEVVVNYGWQYSYAFKSITGNYTNRAQVQLNPDGYPSNTFPFFNTRPYISIPVTGEFTDTAQYPTVAVLRTTDGGETWYILDEIANTGVSISYEDKYLASASGNADPIPDSYLTSPKIGFAPSLTSNSPPPSVAAPKVVGVDEIAPSTPLAYYAGRIWYGIENILFFSSQEELLQGVPEECFPSGLFGNFFRFQEPVTNVHALAEALLIFTAQNTYVLTGTTRETFFVRPLFQNVGMVSTQPTAITKFREYVAFLSTDLRIILTDGQNMRVISDPLGKAFTDKITVHLLQGVYLNYLAYGNQQYLIVSLCLQTAGSVTDSYHWVYDVTRSLGPTLSSIQARSPDFWFPPWTSRASCAATIPVQDDVTGYRIPQLWMAIFGQASFKTGLAQFNFQQDFSGGPRNFDVYDYDPGTGAELYRTIDHYFVTSLFTIPPGNHVNKLRAPYLTPVVHSLVVERILNNGDNDPDVFYFADDLWTTPVPVPAVEDPARRPPSLGYKTMDCMVNTAMHRVGLKVAKTGLAETTEVGNLIVVFNPDSGA